MRAVRVKLLKFCSKCDSEQLHHIKSKAQPVLVCSICAYRGVRRSTLKNWYRYLATKANGRNKDNSIRLTGELVESIAADQGYKCAMSGVPLNPQSESNLLRPSIDRIDGTKGYTKENIRIVIWGLNQLRWNLNDADLLFLCQLVVFSSRNNN